MHPIHQQRAMGLGFEELGLELREHHSLWVELRPKGRPCINADLLRELNTLPKAIAYYKDSPDAIGHLVLHSNRPGIFSLGGDLALFKEQIEARDREGLMAYGHACVQIIYDAATGYGDDVISYALVQGDALGGGMETVLTADYVIMEAQARMGLPEVLFNLFPGMGAATFLARKLKGGMPAAEELMSSGNIYSPEQLRDMGLCDHIVPEGTGREFVAGLIAGNDKQLNSRKLLRKAREIVNPVDKQELVDIVEIWVEYALRLEARDLRMMDRLVGRQGQK